MTPPVAGAHQFTAPRPGPVSGLLAAELSIGSQAARDLIAFGAVYYRRERLAADVEVAQGEWLRVHARPRRFPVRVADWRSRIIGETADYLVVDKPAGLPVHPTCDNGVENLLHCLQLAVGHPLYVCHRLDIGTSGLVVLAKTREFCVSFGRFLEAREVGKIYRARVPNPVAPGTYVHYQADVERGPRPVSSSARPGWKRCELEVLDCRESEEDFELTIRLVTGRTHQIRCQLAALGSPIVGDSLYGSDRRFGDGASEAFALACIELRLPDGGIYLKR